MDWPKYIAHRGASAVAPENSLEALDIAIELGAESVEFDVQPAEDGQLVVFHDETLKRSSGIAKTISQCPLAELLQTQLIYHFGPQTPPICIPSFDQYLEKLLISNIKFNCEVKCFYPHHEHCAEFLAPYIDRLKNADKNVIITSACRGCLEIIKNKYTIDFPFQLGLISRNIHHDTFSFCEKLGLKSLSVYHKSIIQDLLTETRKRSIAVMAYTVNDYNYAQALLEQGVTSIFSDVVF